MSIKLLYKGIFLIVVLLEPISILHCQTLNDTKQLFYDNLLDYNKNIRPSLNQSTPTVVKFKFILSYIEEFDEVKQKLTIISNVGLEWKDDSMKWNPGAYGNLNTFVTESGQFWTPTLILTNAAGNVHKVGADWQAIRFIYDGTAYYYPSDIFTVTCNVDVTLYPRDRHKCSFYFVPQSSLPSEIYLVATSNKIDADFLEQNGVWRYIDSKVETFYGPSFSVAACYLIIERRPSFAMINVVIPTIILGFISVVVFLIPIDSGERISYSITILLSVAVFLTLVGDNLPKTSIKMAFFSYYLLTVLVVVIFISLATVFNLRIYYKDESIPVTYFWERFVNCFRWKRNKQTKNVKHHTVSFEENVSDRTFQNNTESELKPTLNTDNEDLNKRIISKNSNSAYPLQSYENAKTDLQENVRTELGKDISWKDVASMLDKIFFCFFSLVLCATTAVYFIMIFTTERLSLA